MQNERFDINMFFPISMEDLTVFCTAKVHV